jgi:hypothetical protein
MVEDHDGVAGDATETNALPHAEQFQPISLRYRYPGKAIPANENASRRRKCLQYN